MITWSVLTKSGGYRDQTKFNMSIKLLAQIFVKWIFLILFMVQENMAPIINNNITITN